MRKTPFFILRFFCLSACAAGLLFSTTAVAGGRSAADYPLRVHIFQVSQHSHYRDQMLNYVDGEGRANLFENSQPRGFDYGFRCGTRLMASPGFETYLARWKKPGKEVEILLPVMGKPGTMDACDLKVELKETAYFRHSGSLDEEPPAAFREWMERHQYDPEHGKNVPVSLAPADAPPATAQQQ